MTTATRRRSYSRDDVQLSYHSGHHGDPMVNIKVRAWLEDGWKDFASEHPDANPHFTPEWFDAHTNEDLLEGRFMQACEMEFDYFSDWVKEIFEGYRIQVWTAGRQGGWAVVEGLPDVESWDAVLIGKWGKVERIAREIADGIPYHIISSVYLNEFDAWVRL